MKLKIESHVKTKLSCQRQMGGCLDGVWISRNEGCKVGVEVRTSGGGFGAEKLGSSGRREEEGRAEVGATGVRRSRAVAPWTQSTRRGDRSAITALRSPSIRRESGTAVGELKQP